MKQLKKRMGALALAAVLCGAGTAGALSPRQAACYEQITGELLERHGSASADDFFGMRGLVVTVLVDFDGDGIEELVYSYNDGPSEDADPMQQVWTYQAGRAFPLFRHEITNLATDVSPEVILHVGVDRAYLVTGQAVVNGGEVAFWTKQGESWTAGLRFVDGLSAYPDGTWGMERCELNGEPTTPEELDAALNSFLQGTVQRNYSYYGAKSLIIAQQRETIQTLAQAARPVAAPSTAAVRLNGETVHAPAYLIAGNNYFRLRDIAALLDGTQKQFGVLWDGAQNRVALTRGEPYIGDGVSAANTSTAKVQATACMSDFTVDNVPCEFSAYTIGGSNYVKLRDLAAALGFEVSWNAAEGCVEIDAAGGK